MVVAVILIAQGQFWGLICRYGGCGSMWDMSEREELKMAPRTCHSLKGEGRGKVRYVGEDQESVWNMLTLRCHWDIYENITSSWVYKMDLRRSLAVDTNLKLLEHRITCLCIHYISPQYFWFPAEILHKLTIQEGWPCLWLMTVLHSSYGKNYKNDLQQSV